MAAKMAAALMVASFAGVPAWSQSQSQSQSQAHAAAPAPRSAKSRKAVVSPYARAARARERAGNAPAGRAPTMVQGLGKPRKPHAGAPSK